MHERVSVHVTTIHLDIWIGHISSYDIVFESLIGLVTLERARTSGTGEHDSNEDDFDYN